MKVAACQPSLSIDDAGRGWAGVLRLLRDALGAGAEAVVLPELATSGYVFRDADEVAAAAIDAERRLAELEQITQQHPAVVVCGHVEIDGGVAYNSATVLAGGRWLGTHRKAHLWDTEKLWFRAGDHGPLVVSTPVGRIGVMICYDLEFPEYVRLAREAGADLIAAPVNWPLMPRPEGVLPLEIAKAQAAAGAYQVPIVVADRSGPERGVHWVGGSCVVGSDGYLVASPTLSDAEPALVMGEIALAAGTSISERNDALGDRRPELYG